MVEKIGLDATIFLRFIRMNRNIFATMVVVVFGVTLPANLTGSHSVDNYDSLSWLIKLTPLYTFGVRFWAFVVVAYAINFIVCGYLWWNYRAVVRLRRAYFLSQDYLSSLHSRTLFVGHGQTPQIRLLIQTR